MFVILELYFYPLILLGLDLPELRAKAAQIKDNDAERLKVFPPFADEYVVINDDWSSAVTWSSPPINQSVVTLPPVVERESATSAPARSPQEEAPSLSVNPSEATGT